MRKDGFEAAETTRKLYSTLHSNSRTRKTHALQSARNSQRRQPDSHAKQRSTSKEESHGRAPGLYPIDLNTPRSLHLKHTAKTDRETASHTIAKLDSKITEVAQELHTALTNNQAMATEAASLRREKLLLGNETARLQEQLQVLTNSHAGMVQLNDSLSSRLVQAHRELEAAQNTISAGEAALAKRGEEDSKRQSRHEQQLTALKKAHQDSVRRFEEKLETLERSKAELESRLARAESESQEHEKLRRLQETEVEAIKGRLLNSDRLKHQSDTRHSEAQAGRRQSEQLCEELEKRGRQLEQQLAALQAERLQLLAHLAKRREEEAERGQESLRKEQELRQRMEASKDEGRAEYLEQVRKLEQVQLIKIREIQELAASNLLVREKEISLVKVSAASELERLRSQIAQLTLSKGERDSQLKLAEKRISELSGQVAAKIEVIQSLEEKNMQLRLQVEELQYTVGKLNKIASEAKTTAGKEAGNAREAVLYSREKDRRIDELEQENSELAEQCDHLIEKLESFSSKIQNLEAHMHSEAAAKALVESRLRQLQSKSHVNDPGLEQQLRSLAADNEQLRRNMKESKMRQKLSEDKVREMQIQMDEALERETNQQTELERLAQQAKKTRVLSQEVESANRVSEINLKGLLRSLQDKEQLTLSLKDELVKEQFRNDLLVSELKALKQHHKGGNRCSRNHTFVMDNTLQEGNSSRRSDTALRTIDTNNNNDEPRPDKMTI